MEETAYRKRVNLNLILLGVVTRRNFFYGRTADVKLLSVWGIAGVGKSAIVRESFLGKVITGGIYKMHSWVDVPHPFNLTDLCRRLLLDFSRDNLEAKETALISMMEGKDPIPGCCKILRQNNCLLVIDGLRSKHDWDLLKVALFSQPVIGRTIVITRDESVATYCTNRKDDILNVKGLKDDVALDLFKKINSEAEKLSQSCPEVVEPILKHIMSKCGGLPEVIVAAGKIASPYSERISSLEFCNAELMEMLEKSLKGLFCWMQSYFDACSDELKPCIFYMSVFPVDQSIRRRRLLRRWIAEGYSSGGGGGGTVEEKGEKLFSELMKLSILYQDQRTSSRARSCWMVNGFFCEYIKSRPMEDNLVFALEGSCSPSSRLTGQHLTISSCWDRDEIVFKSMDLSRLRSLTVFGKWVPFLVSDKMKVLRVLDLEGTSSTPDGTASVTDDVLEKIVKQFPRLKFMSLRGCMEVTRLPDSLGDMGQLETLDARHTSIVELPPAVITKLHKLQYIRAGTTEARRLAAAAAATTPPPTTTTQEEEEDVHSRARASPFQRASTRITGAWNRTAHALVESSKKQRRLRVRVAANGHGVEVVRVAAEGVGKLTELHTLGVVNIAGGKGGLLLLKELGNLTQLRKLGLSGIGSKNWKELCNAISGHLPHLESLSLQLLLVEEDDSYKFACFHDISMPPKTLKSLKVLYTSAVSAGAFGACIKPAWISQLPNLKKLNHESTVSSQEDIDSMLNIGFPAGLLEKRLRIKPIQQHLSFAKQMPGLVFLTDLMIDCSSTRLTVIFGELPNFSVQVVSIHCCSSCDGCGCSCLQIVGLQNIRGLKQVLVMGPCSHEFKEDLRRQLKEREDKLELIEAVAS